MDFGLTLLLFAIVFSLSLVLRPKPKVTNARPAGLGDFQIPTATEGRIVPLIWGTVRVDGPNVVWYGDFRSVPVTKKVKTGLFSSKKQTIGFNYFLGLQFALCRGTIDAVKKIYVGEKKIFDGTASSGFIDIDKPKFYGGEDANGGLVGRLRVHNGAIGNSPNPYLQSKITSDIPAYRGTSNIVWQGGNIGMSTQIQPWSFELKRIPNVLAVAAGDELINGADANPMCVLYEILTDVDWGLGFTASDIDLVSLRAVAAVLKTEGNGFSMVLDSPTECGELIHEIERQVDGVLYLDRTTGKFNFKLVRNDYVLGSTTILDESNILKVDDFTRGSWQETTNNVRVQFVNRSKNYKTTYAMAQDAANIGLQGNTVVTSDERYPGVMVKGTANQIAFRSLRLIAYPLAKARFTVNRSLHALIPGDVIRWTNASLGLNELPMRITRVDLGKLDEGEIQLDAVQDVFSFETDGLMGDPDDSSWSDPLLTVIPINIVDANRLIFEAPHAFCVRAEEHPGLLNRIWVGTRYPGDQSTAIQIWSNEAAAGYAKAGDTFGFLMRGKLSANLGVGSTQGTVDLTIVPDLDSQEDMLAALTDATPEDIGRLLKNIVKIDDEFIGFQTVTASGGNIVLHDIYRGLMDTIQEAHAINANVWFMSLAGNITEANYQGDSSVDVKPLSDGPYGTYALASATATTIVMSDRAKRPNPPAMVSLNNVAGWATSGSFDFQTGSTLDTKGLKITLLRREFRTTDEVRSVITEDALPPNFPTTHNTQYAMDVYNDPDGDNVFLFTSDWTLSRNTVLSRTKIIRYITENSVGGALADYTFDANDDSDLPAPWTVYVNAGSGFIGDSLDNSAIQQTTNGLAQRANTVDAYRTAYLDLGVTPPVHRTLTGRCRLGLLGGGVQILDRLDLVGHTQNGIYLTFAADDSDLDTNVDQIIVQLYVVTAGGLTFIDAVGVPVVGTATWEGDIVLEVDGDDYTVFVDGTPAFVGPYTLTDHNTQEGVGIGFSGTTTPEVDGFLQFTVEDVDGGGGGFSFPTRMAVNVKTRHTFHTEVLEARKELPWSFDINASELATLHNWGLLARQLSSDVFTATSTGTYTLTLGTALSTGRVQVKINAADFVNLIVPGSNIGTFAVNNTDTIQIRHTQVGDTTHETFAELKDGSNVRKAFAILTF
jgi:hypothetical protein